MKGMTIWSKVGWGLMALMAVGIAIGAITPYLLSPLESKEFLAESFLSQPFWVYLHIAGAGLALVLGPTQFLKGLRDKWRNLHRWMGRFYLIGVLVGGIAGTVIARRSPAGLTDHSVITLLAIIQKPEATSPLTAAGL